MKKNTNPVRRERADKGGLDATDRKLLGLLARNAELSYSELGEQIHLSAPAVHERVKRLKRTGVIRATVAVLDGPKIGKNLLAFVHLETSNWETARHVLDMSDFPEIEEIHTVAGDAAIILKVRTENPAALEDLLIKFHLLEGFKGVKTYIALGTYLERGPLPISE